MVYIIIYVEVEVLRRRYFHVEIGDITLNPPQEKRRVNGRRKEKGLNLKSQRIIALQREHGFTTSTYSRMTIVFQTGKHSNP